MTMAVLTQLMESKEDEQALITALGGNGLAGMLNISYPCKLSFKYLETGVSAGTLYRRALIQLEQHCE